VGRSFVPLKVLVKTGFVAVFGRGSRPQSRAIRRRSAKSFGPSRTSWRINKRDHRGQNFTVGRYLGTKLVTGVVKGPKLCLLAAVSTVRVMYDVKVWYSI
jgi:hypothetical protein